MVIRGFCRRRFDLFAIVRLAWQSWWMYSRFTPSQRTGGAMTSPFSP
jgi:hypothetical protein